MKTLASSALAALLALAAASAARADILTLSIAGTFDSTPTLPSGTNTFEGGVGTTYAMSASVSTDNYLLHRTQVDLGTIPPNNEGWFFGTNSTFQGAGGGWSVSAGGVVANVTNNFYYDGSGGVEPAGYYDELSLTGWLRGSGPVLDPTACAGGGSLLGDVTDGPGPCTLRGPNYAINIDLYGTSSFIAGIGANPFGTLDFSQVLLGSTTLWQFQDGVLVGDIEQDPLLTYHDGVLSGPNMSVSFALSAAPEPGAWALMTLGFGSVGYALRRRRPAVAV